MVSASGGMPLWTRVYADSSELADDIVVTSSAQEGATKSWQGKARPSSNLLRWPLLLCFEEPDDVNKNTAWFSSPGVWSTYVLIVVLAWLFVQAALGCSTIAALAVVNALHFAVTFYLFHWVKGSPFAEDQGLYDKLTWWEQMDGGRQNTMNRKFMLLVPVFLYLFVTLATREVDHSETLFVANTAMVFVLVIAKLPLLHRVRIFGING